MSVLPNTVCLTAYDKWFKMGMFCSGVVGGGRDACQGDSGGPLAQVKQSSKVINGTSF